MREFTIGVITIACISLAGCVPSQGNPDATFIQDGWSLATVSGREIIVEKAYEVNPDCSSYGMPQIKVISGPAHGTTSIKNEKVFPDYKPDNIRSKCNSQAVDGVRVYYRPKPDFVGVDRLITRLSHTNGKVYESTIDITVR